MKTVGGAILIAVALIALASCTSFAPQPAEALMSTPTPLPTKTILPTETSLPTQIPSASPSPLPSEMTLRTWEDVPIMPNAIDEQSDSQSYTFVINELVDNVNTFYQEEMAKYGWTLLRGHGNEMQSFMSFTKDGHTIDMTVVLQLDGRTSVTFEKQAQTQ
jgi:hypothetical protein